MSFLHNVESLKSMPDVMFIYLSVQNLFSAIISEVQ